MLYKIILKRIIHKINNLYENITNNKMSNNDQQLVDHLFQQIFVQQLRCTHFDTVKPKPSSNSVWNKSSDEIAILNLAVAKYKKYYQDKAEEVKTKLNEK